MNCVDRDQDLLLLVHGELRAVRRRALLRHLRGCPGCRERHFQFAAASRHVAAAMRGAREPLRAGSGAPGIPKPGWRLTYLAGLLVVGGIGLAAGAMRLHAAHPDSCRETRAMPCRPGLPNDLCR